MRKLLYILIAGLVIIMTPAIALAQGQDAPSCLVAVEGNDAGALTTDTLAGQGEVELITTVDLEAVPGARVIVEDAVRYQNGCNTDLELGLAGYGQAGAWDGLAVELWLSTTANPEALPGAGTSDWDATAITAGAEGMSANTGSVIVPAGAEVQVAFVLTAASDFDGAATMRWAAEARSAG